VDRLGLVAEVDGRLVGDVPAHLEPAAADADRHLLSDLARTRLLVDTSGWRRPTGAAGRQAADA
jgi:hypothetical protein